MNTAEFLRRILPAEGVYVSLGISGEQREQKSHLNISSLVSQCQTLSDNSYNSYYAISSFKEIGSRQKTNILKTKVVALDIDCGENKPYPTWVEGIKALEKFVGRVNLPVPIIISSGIGLHVYWVLSEALPPDEWQILANSLKQATITAEFKTDVGLIGNGALVLRPVGTINYKNNATVRVLINGPDVNAEDLLSRLNEFNAVQPSKSGNLTSRLVTEYDGPVVTAEVVVSKCKQIEWAVTHQDEVEEPLWYAVLGVAAYCEDSENVAVLWSDKHPEFDLDKTIRKLHQWRNNTTGPTTCDRLKDLRPRGCKDCKLSGKVATPARVGVKYVEIAIAADVPDPIAHAIPLPKPFKRTQEGIKITIDDTDIDVCDFDIYPVSYGYDDRLKYEVVRYHWFRQNCGWQDLVLRQAFISDGHREFSSAIADQGIVLISRAHTDRFQYMLRSYIASLKEVKPLTNLYTSMGWKDDYSKWVMGDSILMVDDGEVKEHNVTMTSTIGKVADELYKSKGTIVQWAGFTKVVENLGMPSHAFALNTGFSAPLFAFGGLKGLVISLYGPTGGGKTLAQYWIQSIWGDPDRLHFSSKYTLNSLFSRIGMYNNMPMTVDEVTTMSEEDVGEFAYWVSQGRDKIRLSKTSEEIPARTWCTPVIVSTNRSINSKLTAIGGDTSAQMARVLELTMEPHPLFKKSSDIGLLLHKGIHACYGVAGREFIRKLLEMGPTKLQDLVDNWRVSFNERYNPGFVGHERYWEQALVISDLAGHLAKKWGFIAYDPSKGTEWAINQLSSARMSMRDNIFDAFDILGEYLTSNLDKSVCVMRTGEGKPICDTQRLPRESLRLRYELYRSNANEGFNKGVVIIDRAHFKSWVTKSRYDFKDTMRELVSEEAISAPQAKVNLGRDTPIRVGTIQVLIVDLTHRRMRGVLSDVVTPNNQGNLLLLPTKSII